MPEERKSDDLTGREILLKAHDACCETLLQLTGHFNVLLPMEGLQGLKISILIATAIKAVNSSLIAAQSGIFLPAGTTALSDMPAPITGSHFPVTRSSRTGFGK